MMEGRVLYRLGDGDDDAIHIQAGEVVRMNGSWRL